MAVALHRKSMFSLRLNLLFFIGMLVFAVGIGGIVPIVKSRNVLLVFL